MKLTQLELEKFVELWQSPTATVDQFVAKFNAAMELNATAREMTVITPREATVIAASVRKELRKRKPPIELLDKRRKATPDYEALAKVAREVNDEL